MSNFDREREPGTWRRRAALLGVITGMGYVSVSAANAQPENTRSALTAKAPEAQADNLSITDSRVTIAQKYNLSKKVIEGLVNSKKPALYYGAIVIKESSSPKIPTISYHTPAKNPEMRVDAPLARGAVVLTDPLVTKVDGVTYAVAVDRGFKDRNGSTVKPAGTGPEDLVNYRYIDLKQAEATGGIEFYSHNGIKPVMLPTYSSYGQLGIKGDVALFNPPLEMASGFNADYLLEDFLAGSNLKPLPKAYTPPFMK